MDASSFEDLDTQIKRGAVRALPASGARERRRPPTKRVGARASSRGYCPPLPPAPEPPAPAEPPLAPAEPLALPEAPAEPALLPLAPLVPEAAPDDAGPPAVPPEAPCSLLVALPWRAPVILQSAGRVACLDLSQRSPMSFECASPAVLLRVVVVVSFNAVLSFAAELVLAAPLPAELLSALDEPLLPMSLDDEELGLELVDPLRPALPLVPALPFIEALPLVDEPVFALVSDEVDAAPLYFDDEPLL
jgi:hypothetical protein